MSRKTQYVNMNIAFTICSNNYFAQAHVLAKSYLAHHPQSRFFIIITDRKNSLISSVDSRIEILEINLIEPNILELASRFNIIELNTAVKPTVFSYLFETTGAVNIFYLDPDIYVYKDFTELTVLLSQHNAILTPHSLSPIPLDGKKQQDNDFLNFGIYNLGFAAFRKSNETTRILEWWKERTYHFGYIKLEFGLFTDQIWMNLVPVYFKDVHILKDECYNMGPWNLHERMLSVDNSTIYVNNNHPLCFYHFSTFNPLLQEMKIHPVFNRFSFENRNDLKEIYTAYKTELLNEGFAEFSSLPCYYVEWRKKQMADAALNEFKQLPVKRKFYKKVKQIVPGKLKKSIQAFIQG